MCSRNALRRVKIKNLRDDHGDHDHIHRLILSLGNRTKGALGTCGGAMWDTPVRRMR